jgi:DNA-binding NarL/FixJ family response regulator
VLTDDSLRCNALRPEPKPFPDLLPSGVEGITISMYRTAHRLPSRHATTACDAVPGAQGPVQLCGPVPVALAIVAEDPMIGQGAEAYLRTRPEVTVLAADHPDGADVVLVLAGVIAEDTLALMEAVARTHPDARFVLVGDGVREHHVLRAVALGMVSVLPRREADFDRIVAAILAMRDGRLELPTAAVGWLAHHLRSIQRDILGPHGLTSAGLETREVDVLRLLAEGLGTPEIATRLAYSERTVKNIIHGVLMRLQLRNRTQAVAYAMRNGVL